MERFCTSDRGRPDLESQEAPVRRGDSDAINFWIKTIARELSECDLMKTWHMFAYLSDLSMDENRAGGYSGFIGNDPDIVALRKALLVQIQTFLPPSAMSTEQQERYMKLFDALFTWAIGILAAGKFRDKLGYNGRQSTAENPYYALSPYKRHELMLAVIKQEASLLS